MFKLKFYLENSCITKTYQKLHLKKPVHQYDIEL